MKKKTPQPSPSTPTPKQVQDFLGDVDPIDPIQPLEVAGEPVREKRTRVAMPAQLYWDLKAHSAKTRKKRSDCVTEALRNYLQASAA